MSKLLNANYVIVKLDVQEQPDKKSLENAGGADYMKQWNGEKAGLPFMVVIDPSGKKLADSNREGTQATNIGYPAKPEEIAYFMSMLKTATRLTEKQRTQIEAWLKEHAPK